ncbi:MAG TPA: hypothetical protein PLR25_03115 [Planctomycetaceae bacterium]|nr:hypothetical protein [Planctomycetaceae bacterium]
MKKLITTGLLSVAVFLALPGTSKADGYWCNTYYAPPVYYAVPTYYAPAPVYYPPRVAYYPPVPSYGVYHGYYRPRAVHHPHRSIYTTRHRTVYRRW